MKPVKYALLMIALLLSPIKLMSMTEDEARDYIKEFISKQQDFGKHDETLKLTFANINIDDNGVKVIFNKEDDVFNPLFPELTEGIRKTMYSIHYSRSLLKESSKPLRRRTDT